MTKRKTKSSSQTAVFLDSSIPNVARIFDFLAGGTAHFEADRVAAEAMLQVIPSIGKWVRLRRAFIQEAAFQLHQEGFRQFIDLGSGMPADDHIHAFVPDSKIVYSDINPVAVSYGQGLFSDNPNIIYIRNDAKQIKNLFYNAEVRQLIDMQQPIALGLNAIMLFLTESENRQLMHTLHDLLPDGSKVFLVFQNRGDQEMPDAYEKFRQQCRAAGLPIELYTYAQSVDMIQPLKVTKAQPIVEFLGLPKDFITEADQTEINLAFYGVFLEK